MENLDTLGLLHAPEVVFLYESFIQSLSDMLISLGAPQKCTLCTCCGTNECGMFSCDEGIRKFLHSASSAYLERMEKSCKAYFAFLDQLEQAGGYDIYTAEQALTVEFPYLANHPEEAKYTMAAWLAAWTAKQSLKIQ